ncbi:Ig domain-containing protein [Solihabitans fulvus]|nr:Ig domain-containing protein [Solihabitans fulvus]
MASLSLVFASVSASASASATDNPYSPAYQHSYRHGAVPTRDQLAKINDYKSAHATPNAVAAGNTLQYGGGIDGIGVTSGHPKVYLVFWGSQWGSQSTDGNGNLTFSSDSAGGAPKLQQMFKGLGTGGELFSGMMTQYCDGPGVASGATSCSASSAHVGYPTGGALSGVWYDNSAAEPGTANGHQLGVEALNAAAHFGNTSAAANRYAQYVILSPTGLDPDGYKTGGFCAWHDYNGDTTLSGGAVSSPYGDFAFTNMPYVMDQGSSCGQNFVNSGSAGTLDGYTIVEGHEYSETITDQNPAGGWTATSGQENADECAWVSPGSQGGAGNVAMGNGSYPEQGSWSNDTNRCDLTHPIIGGGGPGPVSLSNPGNQSSTVNTAASLQLNASGGTSPYSWSASGLPTGLSINASSGLISGTPSATGSFSVTATVRDSSSPVGSASTSFTWAVTPTGGGCSGQKLANPGFESGSASWSATAGVIGQNGPSEPAHSGTWNAWLDGYGSSHTDTLSQSVSIPAGCRATLSFWLHIDTAETGSTAYDKLTVKAGSTTVATFSNVNAASGYVQKSYDVSALAGQTVSVGFTGVEDGSLQTSFVIDDAAVTLG